jgi:hypothetical protein
MGEGQYGLSQHLPEAGSGREADALGESHTSGKGYRARGQGEIDQKKIN